MPVGTKALLTRIVDAYAVTTAGNASEIRLAQLAENRLMAGRADKTDKCRNLLDGVVDNSAKTAIVRDEIRELVVEVRDAAGVPELPARLRELGFVEGEAVRVLRRGQPGGEPLAVRVGVSTFALRRAEARCVRVVPAGGGGT